jgi:GH15 family glucan-1,4-alpha-glucosidase
MGKRLILFFILCSANLFAQKTRLPLMESFFGASSTNAAIGNGRLTVGISKYGDLVNLRWPCSNFFDHLNYKTLYKLPFAWQVEDYNRFYNAGERQGSFAGLKYSLQGKEIITWFKNEDWQQQQSYYSADAPILINTYINNALGIKVTCTDFVLNDIDVLNRHFKIEKIKDEPLLNLQLVYATNMAPCNKKPLFDPSADWYKDNNNGFLTMYDKTEEAFLSFIPAEENKSIRIPKGASANEVHDYINTIENNFPSKDTTLLAIRDIYCAIGANRKTANTALYEDGTLPKSLDDVLKPNDLNAAYGPTLCLAYYDINWNNKQDEISILFSFASNAKKAITQLKKQSSEFNKNLNTTNAYWTNKISKAKLPDIKDKQMINTLKRTLINVLITANPETGAIGSSVSACQPPYTMIWPRDAAVMGYVLDCAGFTEEAEKNALFFAKTQRQFDGQDCRKPSNGECYKGTWFQCYYADGTPSWMYDFEVDEVGWGIWMWYAHSTFLNKEKQKAYLEKLKPNIKLAADFLVVFRDKKNNLQKKAREDDLLWKSQTIIGAATSIMGLKSAISALTILDATDTDIQKYKVRLAELEAATLKEFWKEKTQQFQKAVYGNFGPRGIIIWPSIYWPASDSKMDHHADALSEQLKPFFNKTEKAFNKEWWYIGKATMAMAYAWKDNPERLPIVENYLKQMLTEVCTQDTWVYGETPLVREVYEFVNGKETSKRIYDNRVGQPCNIAAAYIYLTADLLYGSEASKLKYLE